MIRVLVCFLFLVRRGLHSEGSTRDHILAVILNPNEDGDISTRKSVEKVIEDVKAKFLKLGSFEVVYYDSADITYEGIEDITTVFSVVPCDETWNIFNRVHDQGILFLAITDPMCPRLPASRGVTVPMTPEGNELAQIILDLRMTKAIDQKSLHFVYDARTGVESINRIIQVLTLSLPNHSETGSLSLHRIDNHSQSGLMNSLRGVGSVSADKKIVVVLTKLIRIRGILQKARSLKLTDPFSQWLFIADDGKHLLESLSNSIREGENLAFLNKESTDGSLCNGGLRRLIKELLASYAMAVEKWSQEEWMLSKEILPEDWEVIRPTKKENMDSILNFIKGRLNMGCGGWKFWNVLSWMGGVECYEAGKVGITAIGNWSFHLGPQMDDFIFPHSVHGFRKRRLSLLTFHFPPWQTITYDEKGNSFTYGGLVFEIVNELSKRLNFTYNVINLSNSSACLSTKNSIPDDICKKNFGGSNFEGNIEDAVWKKALESVLQNKVFMTAIAFTQTEERKKIVNFTSIAIEPYSLLVSRPRELSRALLFLLPFSVDTWLCIVAVILILGPLLNFVHRTSPFYQHYRSLDRGGFSKLVNCLWYLYGALLQQGGSSLPAADSGRLVVATWWLSVVVMATTYSGNLVAFLTFPKMETKVSNLDQLLQRRHEFTWGMPAASTVHDVLKRANTDKLNQISKRAELHSEMTPQILDRIRYNNHVYIDRKSRLLFTMKRDFLATGICDFSLGKEEFLEEHLGIMMLPGNPYFKIINKEIGRMHRVGLISKWTRDYMPKKDKCWNFNPLYTNGVDNHTVNLSDMQGSFFVLILGILLGILLAVAEKLFKKWKNAKERRIIKPFII